MIEAPAARRPRQILWALIGLEGVCLVVLGVVIVRNLATRPPDPLEGFVGPLTGALQREGFLALDQRLLPPLEVARLACRDEAMCRWLVDVVKDGSREVRLRKDAFYVLRDVEPQDARVAVIEDLLDWRDSLPAPTPGDLQVFQAMARWLPHVLLDTDLAPAEIFPLVTRADPDGWQEAVEQHGQLDATARRDMAPGDIARWDRARVRAAEVLRLGHVGNRADGPG